MKNNNLSKLSFFAAQNSNKNLPGAPGGPEKKCQIKFWIKNIPGGP
jgi:hypothetical protein